MAAKCSECGTVLLPPKPMCTNCLSTNLSWIEIEGAGKLLSYTIVYVAPDQFASMTPYTVGIVEFESGLRLPGMVCDIAPENLRVGLELKVCFDTPISVKWPAWSRYFFRPV
ncbi:MAG: hypothetical protein CW691_01860 [Candidatus Bathyarchaeum sp.]|nr:MAG: hypothetical protein CW691_01860 [Candidatus Bathyarchaeum sp.]